MFQSVLLLGASDKLSVSSSCTHEVASVHVKLVAAYRLSHPKVRAKLVNAGHRESHPHARAAVQEQDHH